MTTVNITDISKKSLLKDEYTARELVVFLVNQLDDKISKWWIDTTLEKPIKMKELYSFLSKEL